MRNGLLFIALFSIHLLPAQDSTRVLSQETYFQWIRAYHPLVRQANLVTAAADASLLEARGGFDPKLLSDVAQKTFDGKNYFTLSESGFKIPTWYGLEFKGLFNTASGSYVNPENNIPAAGQAVLGVKLSLGQGLFIDERRAMLQKAKVLQNASQAERNEAINNILLDAALAYWDWVKAYGELQAIEQARQLSEQRLQGIVAGFVQGDRPEMDTLEGFIQVQNWTFEQNNALLKYRNAGLRLSNFLWYESNTPLEIAETVRPPLADTLNYQPDFPAVDELIRFAQAQHPQLQGYQFKLAQLNIDRRMALEALKPRIDVEYNLLGDGFRLGSYTGDPANGLHDFLLGNFKWGLHFSFPIFLRKERGKLELNRIKIMDTDFSILQKRLEIENKVRDAYNEWQNTRRQIVLYEDIVANYRRLLEAETTRFESGESSIFLVNTREQKLIEAQLKRISLLADFQKNRVKTSWAAGRIN